MTILTRIIRDVKHKTTFLISMYVLIQLDVWVCGKYLDNVWLTGLHLLRPRVIISKPSKEPQLDDNGPQVTKYSYQLFVYMSIFVMLSVNEPSNCLLSLLDCYGRCLMFVNVLPVLSNHTFLVYFLAFFPQLSINSEERFLYSVLTVDISWCFIFNTCM